MSKKKTAGLREGVERGRGIKILCESYGKGLRGGWDDKIFVEEVKNHSKTVMFKHRVFGFT